MQDVVRQVRMRQGIHLPWPRVFLGTIPAPKGEHILSTHRASSIPQPPPPSNQHCLLFSPALGEKLTWCTDRENKVPSLAYTHSLWSSWGSNHGTCTTVECKCIIPGPQNKSKKKTNSRYIAQVPLPPLC
jgi:hypothetical protein